MSTANSIQDLKQMLQDVFTRVTNDLELIKERMNEHFKIEEENTKRVERRIEEDNQRIENRIEDLTKMMDECFKTNP